MRILVYPHAMEIGGSQLNAVELAAAVQDLGHDVTVISEPGPLVERVSAAGLEWLALDPARRRPAPATVRLLRGLIAARGLDVVHGYEWPPGLEAFHAARGHRGCAAVCTVMSMSVAPFLPPSLPLVVGTAEIRQSVVDRRGVRAGAVHLLEPPVDVVSNAPGHPCADFRREYRLTDDRLNVVVVSRLVPELKLEGILTAIEVIGRLAEELPLRLVVVGDGPSRALVEERAAEVNTARGDSTVVVTGQLEDPRPAYAAAAVALGMGGSALRALAFGTPLIVQGERGFFRLLTPASAPTFLSQGWYGLGDGGGGGAATLETILRELVASERLRKELGEYGRKLVTERFSLQQAAKAQVEIYEKALPSGPGGRLEAMASVAGVVAHKLRRRYRRYRGVLDRDDFNAVARGRPS